VDFQPAEASGSALARTLPIEPGQRVLVPRSSIAGPLLVEDLEARGATVETISAYRTTEAPAASLPLLAAALAEGPVGAIFTSGSAARGLVTLADALGARQRVLQLAALCIGAETARVARDLGWQVVEAPSTRAGDMADAAARSILRTVTDGTYPSAAGR
jgi:uroporphyrinogen-III synthase